MIAAAVRLGHDQVTTELLDWADPVLAVDGAVLAAPSQLADSGAVPKLSLFLDDGDVPDSWGQGHDAFEACASLFEARASSVFLGSATYLSGRQ